MASFRGYGGKFSFYPGNKRKPMQTLKMKAEKQRRRMLRVFWRKNRTDNAVTHPGTMRPPHLAQISGVKSSGDELEETHHEGS